MRLFLALPLPEELRTGLSAALSHADIPHGIHLVPSDLWHATLAFLDDVPELDVAPLKDACRVFTDCPGSITLDRIETFPPGNPRLLVAGGKTEPRQDWSAFIEDLRSAMLEFAPAIDRKPWTPHVTLGRGPRDKTLPRFSVSAGPWTWKPGGFSLMKSELGPEGPAYESLHDFFFTPHYD